MTPNTQGDTPTDNSGKITCKKCGREDVFDWNGKGNCSNCFRDEMFGTTPNTPIEDELEQILNNFFILHGVGKDTTLEEVRSRTQAGHAESVLKKELLAWRDKAVAEATRVLRMELESSEGTIKNYENWFVQHEGDSLIDFIEAHAPSSIYDARLARLTTPTKVREEA